MVWPLTVQYTFRCSRCEAVATQSGGRLVVGHALAGRDLPRPTLPSRLSWEEGFGFLCPLHMFEIRVRDVQEMRESCPSVTPAIA